MIEDANAAAINFYGYNYEEITRMRIQEINMLDPEETVQEMASASAEHRNYFNFRHRLANGDIRHVEVYSYPIQSVGKIKLYSIIHDVTPRFEAENALRNRTGIFLAILGAVLIVQAFVIISLVKVGKSRNSVIEELKRSEANYRLLTDSSPDTIARFDGSFRHLSINRMVEKELGLPVEHIIGKTNRELGMPELVVEKWEAGLHAVFQEKKEQVVDIDFETPDGFAHYTSWIVPEITQSGAVNTAISITRNITERKRSEQKIAKTLDIYRKALEGIILSMGTVMSKRDNYTAEHQLRVANLAVAIAEELGLEESRIEGLKLAAEVHDIGKISIPAEILTKPGELTDLEYMIIQTHPRSGYEILCSIDFPWPLAEIIVQHHEKIDGSGYPESLRGDEILLEAKIICLADVVEAMASHRPYRASLGINAALEEIEQQRGILYDEGVVDACLRLFRDKEFKLE
jgi:PAS domain S-box-containing protein/putative nucleotidyltransferase with HDIG domain